MTSYESTFQGAGFPHVFLANMLEGPSGADMVLAAVHAQVVPVWLTFRHIGTLFVQRAAQQDVLDRMQADADPAVAFALCCLVRHCLPSAVSPDMHTPCKPYR